MSHENFWVSYVIVYKIDGMDVSGRFRGEKRLLFFGQNQTKVATVHLARNM